MDTPLTEKKFNEFLVIFEKRMSSLETRMSGLETRMSGLDKTVKEIKGFQDYESKAIEYELQMILETYLKNKNPLNTIEKFPMDRIYDMYNKEITELDAAFLIAPISPKYNYSRLTREEMYTMLPARYKPTDKYKFVLAEAKHHMNTKKIKRKLEQFHKILHVFSLANYLMTNPETNVSAYSPQFIKTIQRYPFFGNMDINGCILYFGAAYWDSGLLDKFKQTINEYKKLTDEFTSATAEQKIAIYRTICKLERNWYVIHDPILSDSDILLSIKNLHSIYNQVEFILPSGNRFLIPVERCT